MLVLGGQGGQRRNGILMVALVRNSVSLILTASEDRPSYYASKPISLQPFRSATSICGG